MTQTHDSSVTDPRVSLIERSDTRTAARNPGRLAEWAARIVHTVCARNPHHLVSLLLGLLLALTLSGCPGDLEDPERFDEPDSAASGGGSGGNKDAATPDAGGDL